MLGKEISFTRKDGFPLRPGTYHGSFLYGKCGYIYFSKLDSALASNLNSQKVVPIPLMLKD